MAGRAAIITGAGSGIGLAIAQCMAAAGAAVLVQDLNADAAEVAARQLRTAGVNAISYGGDISDRRIVEGMVQRLLDQVGSVDVLVNNAGLQHVAPVEEFPPGVWQRMLDVMLTAPFVAIQVVLPHMKRQRWGRILNMSSINGKIGAPFKSGYCTVKHGIIGLTRVTALEVAEHGITVNAICPGYTDTPLVRGQLADLARHHGYETAEDALTKVLYPQIPQRRLLLPEEVGRLAVYLASEQAQGITGQAINISAGLVMH